MAIRIYILINEYCAVIPVFLLLQKINSKMSQKTNFRHLAES